MTSVNYLTIFPDLSAKIRKRYDPPDTRETQWQAFGNTAMILWVPQSLQDHQFLKEDSVPWS